MAVIETLYAAARVPLSGQAADAMRAWLDGHPQHQGGRHDYDLADYGLDRSMVESALARYIDRFGVLAHR